MSETKMQGLSGKKVLVTGAGGFIGSHLVQALLGKGARVRAFLRYNSRGDPGNLVFLPRELADQVELYFGDIQDYQAVARALEDTQIVFHLAANIAIPYSYVHPGDTVSTNVMGTYNVLMACKQIGIERTLVVSTSEVYGTALTEKIDEQHPLQAQSPYSASKIGAEKLAQSFFLSFDLPVTIVRPFNTYGPRQSVRAVIPTIIRQLLASNEVVLGDPTPTRDFNYCTDIAEGMIAAVTEQDALGETINLGSGTDISIGELAETVATILGKQPRILKEDRRTRPSKSEVRRLCCDNNKARTLLAWGPKVSLEEGLTQTIRWFQESPDRFVRDTYFL